MDEIVEYRERRDSEIGGMKEVGNGRYSAGVRVMAIVEGGGTLKSHVER